MLVLSRKTAETILIGDDIRITVIRIAQKGGRAQVRAGHPGPGRSAGRPGGAAAADRPRAADPGGADGLAAGFSGAERSVIHGDEKGETCNRVHGTSWRVFRLRQGYER